jgi:hypothetical protein
MIASFRQAGHQSALVFCSKKGTEAQLAVLRNRPRPLSAMVLLLRPEGAWVLAYRRGYIISTTADLQTPVIRCERHNYAALKHPKVRAWLARYPRWTFHFTPTSCSRVNAVKSFFATLTRRRLRRGCLPFARRPASGDQPLFRRAQQLNR